MDLEGVFERLLARSRWEGTCLVWTGSRTKKGYGYLKVGGRAGKSHGIHRLAWMIYNKTTIPDGIHVLHRCDNPPCFRKKHLFLGTPRDNMRDMSEKGRGRGQFQAGTTMSAAERKRRSEANKGRPKTPEHREKIRQAALKRWEKRRNNE